MEVQKKTELFKRILQFIDNNVDDSVQKELLDLFEAIVSARQKQNFDPPSQISPTSLQFLETNIWFNPSLVHWTIDQLLCIWSTLFAATDSSLQDIYQNVLRNILKPSSIGSTTEAQSSYYAIKNTNFLNEKHLAILLCILSKLNITECKENHLIEWINPILLKSCRFKDIELSLYSRKDLNCYKIWNKFLDNILVHREAPETLENSLNIINAIFQSSEEIFHICADQLLLRTIKTNNHWLLDLLNICYILSLNNRFDLILKILQNSSLTNFWIMILLKILTEPSEISIQQLKYLISNSKLKSLKIEMLNRLEIILLNQLDVFHWISENATSSKISLTDTLNNLQLSSALSIIKSCVNLHEINQDIGDLLGDCNNSKTIYSAYSVMLNAIKAIFLCDNYNSEFEGVSECFSLMEKHLNNLNPLSIRLETMENIFSMMFIRHEDFCLESDNTSDCGEDDDDEERGRGQSFDRRKSCDEKKCIRKKNQTGFICNKYAIRETIHYLNRCLFVATNDLLEHGKVFDGQVEGMEENEDRISGMRKYLSEAVWRLELLTSPEFLKKQGLPDNESQEYSIVRSNKVINQPECRGNFYQANEESSSEDNDIRRSDIDASSESGSMGLNGFNNNNNNQSKRKRRREFKNNRATGNSGKNEKKECSSSLNYMLATTETLVLRCLWKNNYEEAQRVIETLGMDINNSFFTGEIKFSREIKTFRQDIKKQNIIAMDIDYPTYSNHSTIYIIRQAVKDGFQASRKTSQLETFLASQESNITLLCNNSTNPKYLITLTALDITLTSCHDYNTSENLIEVTKKHFESIEQLINNHYFDLFQTIYQLLHENKHEKTLSVIRIINDASCPLSLREYKKRFQYWSELKYNLIPLENKTKLIDQLDNSTLELKKNLNNLQTMCNNGDPYLHNIEAYLEILMKISPKSKDFNQMDPSLLKNSLDLYIGYQIFYLNIDLQLLEKIANQLNINLIYSILINCCPKLLYYNNNTIEPHKIMMNKWGWIILNKFNDVKYSNGENLIDPNQCVIEILSELLEFIKKINIDTSVLTQSTLINLSRNEKVQEILRKTEILSCVDLSHLSFGNHTLSFFLNLWNLLFLHSSINIWSHNPPQNHLRHAVSLRTIGYKVGDLDFVTIFSLRTKLLGHLTLDYGPCFNSYIEELNEPAWQDLDLQQDPRTMFGMINEYNVSPIIMIYHPDTINDNLNSAIQQYVDFYKVEEFKHEILLPELFKKNFDITRARFSSENICEMDNNIESITPKYIYNIKLNYRKFPDKCNNKIETSYSIGDGAWKIRDISQNILQYLETHCWLLCYLVERIHKKWPLENLNFDNRRTAVLENLFNSSSTKNLKILFNDNKVVTGLQNHVPISHLWNYLETLLIEKELKKSLELLNNLPDAFIIKNMEIQKLKDKILMEMIDNMDASNNSSEILQYLYQINNEYNVIVVILSKVKVWQVRTCEEALCHILYHSHNNEIPAHCKLQLNEILCRVMVFDKMLPYFKNQLEKTEFINWYNVVYRTEKTDPTKIVKALIDTKQYELCLEWLEYQTASSDLHSLVSQNLFLGLLNNNKNNDFKHAKKLLSALPIGQSEKLCKGVIDRVQSLESLKFVISYLVNNSGDVEKYKRGELGIDLLEILDAKDRDDYIHLITEPFLFLEQLLMNCKFDNLQRILKISTDKLKNLGFTMEKFDKIVRFYANKSLDLRVAVQRDQSEGLSSKLILKDSGEILNFIMPLEPPTRDEWIPNDKARECSCCKNVIFSMFNRRHHCRRCGRVVCGSCSNQRMIITGYANSVPVRICNDCKTITAQLQAVPSAYNSEKAFDCWKLTTDDNHNKILREEFCFEYAPNISLCLAILNLHSDHEAYANFLQDQCDEMKRFLYPDTKGQINREIDHGLIIKMIKSLLIAAKVKCAKLGLNTGITHCDRFLSHIDFIDTLVKSDCLYLLPRDDLNEHTFRRLRDLFTEKEQWILALDVCTKSGLDTQGVWAAWGKACLKVGYYERAREKFSHCLDKVNQGDFDDWVVLPYPSPTTIATTRSELKFIKNRPIKDPPLIGEILQILESCNILTEQQYSNNQLCHLKNSTAQEIINTLSNLKSISHGQYTLSKIITSNRKNIQYQESLYYLLMYGCFNSIIEFFIRHDELDKCLSYTLENDIDQEIFFNVAIIGCLKLGKLMKLCETMRMKDTTLITWKKYLISTCLYLERKQLMNTLYQIQLFMKDYVRASMTCIKFYVTDATTYTDLYTRTHYLIDAQKHLESELELETFGGGGGGGSSISSSSSSKKRRKSASSNISGQSGSLTMEMDPCEIDKHVNTISRQMEIAKFLSNCEREGRNVIDYLGKLSYMESEGLQPRSVPTLFGNQKERTHLAVLAILCGRDVEEGFGFAFRIMQDYYLSHQKVYSLVGHILALDKRVGSIEQLIKCCRSSGAPNSQTISDRVLAHCVKLLLDKSKAEASLSPRAQIDCLIRIINDVEMKIDSYIESKQLKAAYLLAVKHSRAQDIRKILREADRLGQGPIKSICTKWLQQAQK